MDKHRKLAILITVFAFFLATVACDLSTILPAGEKTPLPALPADEAATSVAAVLATSAAVDAPTEAAEEVDVLPTEEVADTPEGTPAETTAEETQPAPDENAIPGMKKFAGKGVEMYLPDTFVGGNLDNDINLIIDRLKKLGPDFDSTVKMIEQNRSSFALWAFDSKLSSTKFMTNVSVIHVKELSGMTLQTLLDASVAEIQGKATISAQDIVQLGNYEMGRLALSITQNGITAKEQVYVILENDVSWVVTFTSSPGEFNKRQPVFDQCMETFKIVE